MTKVCKIKKEQISKGDKPIKEDYNASSNVNNAQHQAAGLPKAALNADEQNIDPAAKAIMQSVARAHDKIATKRATMDAQGKGDAPLYLLVGEDHESLQHYLHHILLLDSLKTMGRHISVAYEQPYDLLARFYNPDRSYLDNPTIVNGLLQADQKTALSLKLRFYQAENPAAYFAHKSLAHYVLQSFANGDDVSFISSDISYDCDEIIECADPKARSAIALCGEDPDGLFHIASPEGMKIRNAHMATMLQQRAQACQAGLSVQFCGKAHINGDMTDNAPEHGLAQRLKAMGGEVLALSLLTDEFTMPRQGLGEDEIIECQTPLGPRAEYNPYFALTTRKEHKAHNDNVLRSKPEEAAYLQSYLAQFGMGDSILDIKKYEMLKEQYCADMQNHYVRIRSAAHGVQIYVPS